MKETGGWRRKCLPSSCLKSDKRRGVVALVLGEISERQVAPVVDGTVTDGNDDMPVACESTGTTVTRTEEGIEDV